jgi:8-oxo-dGTP pyrophosphatase MutT (NUDIX family)
VAELDPGEVLAAPRDATSWPLRGFTGSTTACCQPVSDTRGNYRPAPARARDAGTLVVLREAPCGLEVLLGRRHSRSSFMPDFWVFPGGAVEPEDARARPASTLHPGIVAHARVQGRAARARAIAMAAVRETFEETGLLLGAPGDVGEHAGEPWDPLRNLGLAPDLARLLFVGRAITPTRSRIRYHARFFVTESRYCHGAIRGNGELAEIDWLPVAGLAELPLARVTAYMLRRAVDVARHPAEHLHESVLYAQRGNTRRITRRMLPDVGDV